MSFSIKIDQGIVKRTIQGIFRYPVKGLGGEELPEVELSERGIPFDREWMITDLEGQFITQREIPAMAMISASMSNDSLILHHRTLEDHISLPISGSEKGKIINTKIWSRHHDGLEESGAINQWLSNHMNREVRLVRVTETGGYRRKLSIPPFSIRIPFADGYPLLIIGTKSLEELNSRLDSPVNMDRFRPNLVIHSAKPFEEDEAGKILINDGIIELIKPCPRCKVVTIDQERGIPGKEPLHTLSTFRKFKNQVLFGMYGHTTGKLQIKSGAPIKLI